jgi:hypothetical protein
MACANPPAALRPLAPGLLFAPPATTTIPTTIGTTTMVFAFFVPRPQSCPRFPRELFEPDAAVLRNNGLCSGMTCDSSSCGQAPWFWE